MRQYAGFGNAESANKRFQYLLSQGVSGLSVAFDLPTQMGRDPDHKLSDGEVGKVGVSICNSQDIEVLFNKINLADVSVSMTINSTASILLSLLCVLAKKNNIPISQLKGTTQNDILKEYIARGTYIYPPTGAMKLTTDLIEFCKNEIPSWNTISISGYHIREAGSTAIQEVAFTLADGIAYVKAALSAGLNVDDFAPRLSFFFNCHNNFLEEVAKFRAARKLWSHIIKNQFGSQKKESMQLRFHTQTAGSSLTAQQPLNNVVRTTIQAMAAVMGGTQSLHTNSYDEALGLPTEDSALLALRTQQIIAHESGIADIVDALGGSYVIEELTDKIYQESLSLIDKIENLGGMVKAIEQNFPQSEIEKAAYNYQLSVEKAEQIVVGVNSFQSIKETDIPVEPKSSQDEQLQKEKLKKFRENRDNVASQMALGELKNCATLDQNTIPYTILALEKGATLGEISDIFRQVFGEYKV
jgi:methylmalonyl-CoA mutase N-terminal domain/subunit